jgi:hypothetical protein
MNSTDSKFNILLKSIITGTSITVIVSVFPLLNLINVCCCIGVISGGFLGSAYYYSKHNKSELVLNPKEFLMIGLLSGVLAGVIITVINFLFVIMSNDNPMNEMFQLFNNYSVDLPPEFRNKLNDFSNEFEKYGFSPTILIVSFIINIIIYPLFSTIGGFLFTLIKKIK